LSRQRIRIFVVVSVRLYRDGITDALQQDRRFRVIGSYGSLDAARRGLHATAEPADVALVDVHLGDGAETVRSLHSAWPETGVVALAVREEEEDVVGWVEAGASGLVARDATLGELLDALEAAARGELLCTPTVAAALLRRVASAAGALAATGEVAVGEGPALTRREREIVGLIADGLSNKEIATSLYIEVPTVKNHVHNILEKLRVGRRDEAVTAARERGELDRI
jgi:DNA-binding NarL/FixJ family response regulator